MLVSQHAPVAKRRGSLTIPWPTLVDPRQKDRHLASTIPLCSQRSSKRAVQKTATKHQAHAHQPLIGVKPPKARMTSSCWRRISNSVPSSRICTGSCGEMRVSPCPAQVKPARFVRFESQQRSPTTTVSKLSIHKLAGSSRDAAPSTKRPRSPYDADIGGDRKRSSFDASALHSQPSEVSRDKTTSSASRHYERSSTETPDASRSSAVAPSIVSWRAAVPRHVSSSTAPHYRNEPASRPHSTPSRPPHSHHCHPCREGKRSIDFSRLASARAGSLQSSTATR